MCACFALWVLYVTRRLLPLRILSLVYLVVPELCGQAVVCFSDERVVSSNISIFRGLYVVLVTMGYKHALQFVFLHQGLCYVILGQAPLGNL